MTHLSRTTHGIAYDTTHDEIVAPNPLAAAIVIFRGGASGEEAPIRTIQGAWTGLSRPETVAVDEKNNELVVGDPGDRRIIIYKRDADGDVKPLRTIQGPKTKLLQVVGVAVDPMRDVDDLETELILSDLVVMEKRLERLEKDRKKIKNPELDRE